MKTKRTTLTLLAAVTMLLCSMATSANAQNVDVRLSAREAYVGMPVVLQIAIQNASDYQEPTVPEIDGCDVRAAGSPAQSSQITIINGRRRESRSVTLQYLITPRRIGTFEIPSLTINVDGRDQKTQPVRFVATKSGTGDLLFVEIEGGKDKVFVGQPLDLTLKIWVKPFVDRENNIKLSEANMWQMISEQTSWGSFSERLKELAENNQRPGGQEVLRDDGNGTEREYYLYEIKATVYPKRPGKIDADDVQIVINYPTGLGKSRDPFESLLGGRGFGGMSSRMQQLMGDDFFGDSAFGGSPFGNRLSITSSRPIVGQASVDSTEVTPVPTEGRPADYRGAVGRYKIVTQATPTAVSAGDPITLNIGVIGTGPMELVQAPPLTELSSLTADFKVADQTLAGFVKDETKVFPTTIRPRREGITQIPAIPFSFFDPETETFQTVMSNPISISVDKSESLALDAIVGNARSRKNGADSNGSAADASLKPNFTNDNSASVLVSQTPVSSSQWWWAFVVVPPLVWLATALIRNRDRIANRLPRFRSARARCLKAIERATARTQIENALIQYVSGRTGQANLTVSTAIGAMRTNGMYRIANELESFFQSSEHASFSGGGQESLNELQSKALELAGKMETAFKSMSRSQVRRSDRRSKKTRRVVRTSQKASLMLLPVLFAFSASSAIAGGQEDMANLSNRDSTEIQSHIELADSQRQTILQEAGELYSQAMARSETDSAEVNDLFTSAAEKYQLLVDAGVTNSGMYINLGNAYLQSNQLGRAIASYQRAKRLDPTNRQLRANLELATSLVKGPAASTATDGESNSTSLHNVMGNLRSYNDTVTGFIGLNAVIWTLVISSLLFWGIFIARAAGYQAVRKRWAIVPLLLLAISLASVTISTTSATESVNGIVVANNVALRSGDGEQFDEIYSSDESQGHRVEILAERGNWMQVKTAQGHVGWMSGNSLEKLN